MLQDASVETTLENPTLARGRSHGGCEDGVLGEPRLWAAKRDVGGGRGRERVGVDGDEILSRISGTAISAMWKTPDFRKIYKIKIRELIRNVRAQKYIFISKFKRSYLSNHIRNHALLLNWRSLNDDETS